MKNITRSIGGVLAVLVLLCTLTAYDSKPDAPDTAGNDQNTTQNTDAGKDKVTQIMPAITEQQMQALAVSPEQLWDMGELVGAMDVQNDEAVPDALLYSINVATMYENIEEAGIDPETMIFSGANELLDENNELKSSVKFMLIELTVQNVRAEQERNITDLRILCADTDSAFDENAEASFFELYPSEPVYFSNPTGKRLGDDWKEYYNYSLPVGQSKTLKVGWCVDTEQCDPQNLYLTFGYDEYQKYIRLVF